jgi:hypothetical protein
VRRPTSNRAGVSGPRALHNQRNMKMEGNRGTRAKRARLLHFLHLDVRHAWRHAPGLHERTQLLGALKLPPVQLLPHCDKTPLHVVVAGCGREDEPRCNSSTQLPHANGPRRPAHERGVCQMDCISPLRCPQLSQGAVVSIAIACAMH